MPRRGRSVAATVSAALIAVTPVVLTGRVVQLYFSTRDDLARAQRTIEDVIGVRVSLARPPYGIRTPAYFAAARTLGLRIVQWSVAGFDWKPLTADRVASHVLSGARPGAIVLLHDADSEGKRDRRATVGSIPLIADGVCARGLSVASLEALLPSPEFRSMNA